LLGVENQTSLNDLDKDEEASKFISSKRAAFPPVSELGSGISV
jgi:hypothetical protein